MTSPICHGAAGGCTVDISHDTHHSDDCPTMQTRVMQPCPGLGHIGAGHSPDCARPFTPPIPPPKRTMGQCPHAAALHANPDAHLPCGMTYHQPDCPALYPLQRQPGDENDALTRLAALLRDVPEDPGSARVAAALDLISEARKERRAAMQGLSTTMTDALSKVTAELARAKALVTTLHNTQSEARQRAFRDMAAEMAEMPLGKMAAHVLAILEEAKESDP